MQTLSSTNSACSQCGNRTSTWCIHYQSTRPYQSSFAKLNSLYNYQSSNHLQRYANDGNQTIFPNHPLDGVQSLTNFSGEFRANYFQEGIRPQGPNSGLEYDQWFKPQSDTAVQETDYGPPVSYIRRFEQYSESYVHSPYIPDVERQATCSILSPQHRLELIYATPSSSRNPGRRSYDCPECGNTLKSKQSLKHHIDAKHKKNKRYTCVECKAKFSYQQSWRRHERESRCPAVPS